MKEFIGFMKRVCNKCEVQCEGIRTCEGNMEGICDGCVNYLGVLLS